MIYSELFDIIDELKEDIWDAETTELTDLSSFLAAWQLALAKEDFKENRVADFLLEAAFLQQGSKAVGELARGWQNEQPRGYLYWLQQLEKEKNWPTLRNAALETIAVLPLDRNRLQAADF